MTAKLTDDNANISQTVDITQSKEEWSTTIDWPKDLKGASEKVVVGGIATITYDSTNNTATVTYSAKSAK